MARHLVTGAAGFIGFHTSKRLLERGDEVVSIGLVGVGWVELLSLRRGKPGRAV